MIWTTACALQGTLRPLRTLETLIYQRFQNRHRELICWILPSLLHQSFHIYVFNTFEDWLSNSSQLATTNFFPITGLYTCALVVVPTTDTSLYTKSRSFLFRCRSIFATTVKFRNRSACLYWYSAVDPPTVSTSCAQCVVCPVATHFCNLQFSYWICHFLNEYAVFMRG